MTIRCNQNLFNAAAVAAALLALAGCNKATETTGAPPPVISVGTEIDDGVVTARVKAALLDDEVVRSGEFKVETRKGEVQLSGFVSNQPQIDRAVEVTRAVTGVKSIQNNVVLKGTPTTLGNEVDDDIVTAGVKAALFADAAVKSSDVAVATRKGVVQLSGFVNNPGQMDRAIEVTRGVKGVKSVDNQMSIKK